jgi:hypothetical protein
MPSIRANLKGCRSANSVRGAVRTLSLVDEETLSGRLPLDEEEP